jgi:glycosyltransferase involved in cell wall biosynthesis
VIQPPSISIVTPSLNQATFLDEALLSVRHQNYKCLEHIVMDGGSNDATTAILKGHSAREGWEHLQWVSEPDRGQSDALNKGFNRARGEIVGWLNSDDRYRANCFTAVAKAFQDNPDLDIVYGDSTWIDAKGRVFRLRREIEFSYFILLYHRVLYIPTTTTFFRRRIFDEGNLLDESFDYAMDFEFFVRLAGLGYRFQHVPSVLGDFRFQPDSKSSLMSRKQLEEVNVVMERYSPLSAQLQAAALRNVGFMLLRSSAAILRYFRKLSRGYYLDQFRLSTMRF